MRVVANKDLKELVQNTDSAVSAYLKYMGMGVVSPGYLSCCLMMSTVKSSQKWQTALHGGQLSTVVLCDWLQQHNTHHHTNLAPNRQRGQHS